MKLSVALIALNEEENISRCLQSLDFANEIIVVDGGSQDETIDAIKKATKKYHLPVQLYYHPWENHFSKQRQISFQYCTGDWIMRVDADEIVGKIIRQDIRVVLEQLEESIQNVRIRQVNLYPDEDHYSANLGGWETWPRIFRNRKDLRWVGQVHEFIEGSEKDCINWSTPIFHFGWLNKEKYWQKGEMYSKIPDSGFYTPEELVNREYIVRPLWKPKEELW